MYKLYKYDIFYINMSEKFLDNKDAVRLLEEQFEAELAEKIEDGFFQYDIPLEDMPVITSYTDGIGAMVDEL